MLEHAGKPVPVGLKALGSEFLTARTTLCSYSLPLKIGVVQDALHRPIFLHFLLEVTLSLVPL